MAKALLIAEKASVKNDVLNYINKHGHTDDITCINMQGHLIRLIEPNEYCEAWDKAWNLEVLPMIPETWKYDVMRDEKIKKIYKMIEAEVLSGKYDYVINAADPDREGQAIFWYVYNQTGSSLPVYRYWEKGNTDTQIKHALQNLEDEKKSVRLNNLKKAAFLRAHLDWLIGMNGTRAASIVMKSIAKIGRVKTVILKILCDNELRIQNFKPVTSYYIQAETDVVIGDDDKLFLMHVEKVETEDGKDNFVGYSFEDKEKALALTKTLSTNLKIYDFSENISKQKADKLYTQSDLQIDAASNFYYKVEDTLAISQSLYDKKITTYPRTDNPYITSSEAKEFKKKIQACLNIPSVQMFAEEILDNPDWIRRAQKDGRYVKDFGDDENVGHDAIVLTGQNFDYNSLSDKEKDILTIVSKRFLAIFYPSKEVQQITIIAETNNEYFRRNANFIKNPGWGVIYDMVEEPPLSFKLKVGEIIPVQEYTLGESVTTPPKRINDARLIEIMKNPGKYLLDQGLKATITSIKGIGTEATRASIVTQLCSTRDGYVEIKGKSHLLYPTEIGMRLISNLGNMEITSVDLTANWENKFIEVSNGSLTFEECYDEMVQYTREMVNTFKTNKFQYLTDKKDTEREIVGKCPSCGGYVYESQKAYYCENFNGMDADSDSCKVIVSKNIKGAKISKKNIKKILEGEISDPVEMTLEKDGKKIKSKARFHYEENAKRISIYRVPHKEVGTCPKCGGLLIESETSVYCQNRNGANKCEVSMGKHFLEASLTSSEIVSMFNGEKTKLHKFVTKDKENPKLKKTFEAYLTYNVDICKLNFEFPARQEQNYSEVGKCPCCDGNIVGPISGKFGEYYACEKKCGLNISKSQGGHKLTKKELTILLNGNKTEVIQMKGKSGNSYKAKLFINKSTKKVDREFA